MSAPPLVTGLDRLLDRVQVLRGRRFGFLGHAASVTGDLEPAHLALGRRGAVPTLLLGPEHGYYGVEQDMVASRSERDPWTGAPIVSLYGEDESSLRPDPAVFEGLDLAVVDLQDVGARYYTFAATAVWTAQAALAAGVEVWVLDRPNPLGGEIVEGNVVAPGYHSFVGAFPHPARHGLTVGEIVRMELERAGRRRDGLTVWPVRGVPRAARADAWRRPWIAPSPNMPDPITALLYPGLCLIEGTTLSEGRGTTRPFRLIGAPGIDGPRVAEALAAVDLPGLRVLPTFFRPQFQKHAGAICGGIEIAVTDPGAVRPYRAGVEILRGLRREAPAAWDFRREAYEFVADRPAIDLLTGSDEFRRALEGDGGAPDEARLDRWIDSWPAQEEAFRAARAPFLADDGD